MEKTIATRPKKALTVQQVCDELNVSRATVCRWIALGHLRAVKLDGSSKQPIVRIYREDLDRYLAGKETVER